LKDKGERRENTIAGSWYCSDPCCKKPEEKSVGRLFKFNKELNGKLNWENFYFSANHFHQT
jgi:hypothetical protein